MSIPSHKLPFAGIVLLLSVLGINSAAAQGSPFGSTLPLNGPIPPGISVPPSLRSKLEDLLSRLAGVERRLLPPGPPVACRCSSLTVVPNVIPDDSSRFSVPEIRPLTVYCGSKKVTQSTATDIDVLSGWLLNGVRIHVTVYSTDKPWIAQVDDSGLVEAVSPGLAAIGIASMELELRPSGLHSCFSVGGLSVTVEESYSSAVLADRPLGYWRLGEVQEPLALDSSGYGLHGNLTSGVAAGIPGLLARDSDKAMFFSDGGILFPTASGLVLEASKGVTVEAWVSTTSPSSQLVFSQQNCTPEAVQLWVSDGVPMFRITSDFHVDVRVFAAADVSDGLPHHLVGVRDTGTGELRIYVDGSLAGTVPDTNRTSGSLTSPDTETWIGRRAWCGDTSPFSGIIDEVAVYGTALEEERIFEHFFLGWQ